MSKKKGKTKASKTKKSAKSSKKATYRIRNWAAYNQSLVERGSITLWISEDVLANWHPKVDGKRLRGGQVNYSDQAIECLLMLKAVYRLPYRQTVGFAQSVLDFLGADVRVPDYTTLCKRSTELTVSLPTSNPDEPKHIVVGSTGLKIYGEGEWKVRQHGYSKCRTWRKLYLSVDENSHEIQALALTEAGVDDAEAGQQLLDDTSGEIEQVSANVKSGESSTGSSRQHNGRLGKIEQSSVGVYLGYAKDRVWTLIDGELFLPEKWFNKSYRAWRDKTEIPSERAVFQSKIELGWEMIERAQTAGLPFAAVAFDSLYGRSFWLREQCHQAEIEYYADVPANQQLYLAPPILEFKRTKHAKASKKFSVVGQEALKASDLAQWPETEWESLTLRPNERSLLTADFAMQRVWVVSTKGIIREETLLMKRNSNEIRYSLSNALSNTPLLTLAQRKSQRVEHSIQDAKSELGMDEFQAIKYRAWQHGVFCIVPRVGLF